MSNGYNPLAYRSGIGQAVANIGQQIGGTIARIPQLQQQERFNAQQERQNEANLARQDLEMRKFQEIEKQISENPAMVTIMGETMTNELEESVQQMSPKLQEIFTPQVDAYKKYWEQYRNMNRLDSNAAQQAIRKIQDDWKVLNQVMRITEAAGSVPGAQTKEEALFALSKIIPDIPASKVKDTLALQGLPSAPKPASEKDRIDLEKSRIGLDIAKTKLEQARTPKATDTLPRERFEASEERAMLSEVGKIDSRLSELRSSIPEKEAIVEAFTRGSTFDEDSESVVAPTVLDKKTGLQIPVTKEMSDQALSELEAINKEMKALIDRRQRQEAVFEKVRGGTTDAATPMGDASQVGDIEGGWTRKAQPISNMRKNVFKKIRRYDDIIKEASAAHGVPENLIRAVINQESMGNPKAKSHKNAIGLMQLMPGTAADMGVKDSSDPRQNVMGGTKYLAQQLKKFANIELALAAYNAGPKRVEKLGRVPNFKETQKYVSMIRGYLDYLEGESPTARTEAPTPTQTKTPIQVASADSTAQAVSPATPTTPRSGRAARAAAIEQRWDQGSDDDKKRIFQRINKDLYPELFARFEREIVDILKKGTMSE